MAAAARAATWCADRRKVVMVAPEARPDFPAEWGREDSNLRRQSQRVYSPSPLAAREHPPGERHCSQAHAQSRLSGVVPCHVTNPSADTRATVVLKQPFPFLRWILNTAFPLSPVACRPAK